MVVMWFGAILSSLIISAAAAAAPDTDSRDVSALQALHKALQDPSGKLNSWNSGDPCASFWEGVICESLDNHRSVTELHLMNYKLGGTIAPELGNMTNLKILNLMWNNITGSIPANLGKATTIELLLLNGNQLIGTIPDEIGNLLNMNRFQIDQNNITGHIPSSFGRLNAIKHLHMNNNSLTGGIPAELGKLPTLYHILVDNNQLTGDLPVELANISTLQILQVDNNQLNSTVPSEYGNMIALLKLSLRNCSLQGQIPDLSGLQLLEYADLSYNKFTGNIPSQLPPNVTTMNAAHNQLEGNISAALAHHDKIQALLLSNNKLSGSVPIDFVQLNPSHKVILDFQNNSLDGFTMNFNGVTDPNVILRLSGNQKICGAVNSFPVICSPQNFDQQSADELEDVIPQCDPGTCDPNVNELMPALAAEGKCRCVSRIIIWCRLKSPGFTFFGTYRQIFSDYIAADLGLLQRQVYVASSTWEPGPRLFISLKIFPPVLNDGDKRQLNQSEVKQIFEKFAGWKIQDNPLFGPRELIAFFPPFGTDLFGGESGNSSGLTKGALAGVLVGVIAGTAILVALAVYRLSRRQRKYRPSSSKRSLLASSVKIDNVKSFSFKEMSMATDSFSNARQIGKGGYGKVYKGIIEEKQAVAIKRADWESHQGETEFFTEIELLSRIHHRNLVSLVGFCVDQDEQMLVYEYIGGGTLSSRLTTKPPLNFKRRVYIALGAARGILYLHTEANPPIIHRDIKGTNILIAERDNAKVADFGLSKLAPEEQADGESGHVSTVVKGTPGYLDPEYFLTRKLSDKSDVYSFGVVLLELVTGMQAISHGKNLVREVRAAYEEGIALTIVDPLMGAYPSEAMEPFVRLALSCCLDTPEGRPSIRVVVRDLEDIWKNMSSWIEEYDPDVKTPRALSISRFDVISAGAGSSSSKTLDDFSANNLGPVAPR